MGGQERHSLARLFCDSELFRRDIGTARSFDDAVRIARTFGLDVTAEDFRQLSVDDLSPELHREIDRW